MGSGTTLSVGGTTTTNGITNTGNIGTGTLSTTGLATLNSAAVNNTLAVTGATTTNGIANTGDLTNTGNIGTGTLSTTGLATLNSAAVNNNATVGGTLGVTGPTTLQSALHVSGQSNLNGGANVSTQLAVAPATNVNMGGNRVESVGGPVDATDAATKGYVDAHMGMPPHALHQLNSLNNQINQAFKKINENTEGIAVAMAMGGLALPDKKAFAISANFGFYDGEQAFGTQAAIRLTDTFALTGGVGAGLQQGKVGGRVGFMAAW